MLTILATEASNDGGVNVLLIAVIIVAIAAGLYFWRKR